MINKLELVLSQETITIVARQYFLFNFRSEIKVRLFQFPA